mmetsp:Transcript_5644/g.15887  ORF Transcript_5644/g.15887 Transcript_5644/m.15887 type:complete len:260 (+) Transcript_5644:942-1721(+)
MDAKDLSNSKYDGDMGPGDVDGIALDESFAPKELSKVPAVGNGREGEAKSSVDTPRTRPFFLTPSVSATKPSPFVSPTKCCKVRTSLWASLYRSATSPSLLSCSANLSSAAVSASANFEARTFSFIHISFACTSNCSRSLSLSSHCSCLCRHILTASFASRSSRSTASRRCCSCWHLSSVASPAMVARREDKGGNPSCRPPAAVRCNCRSSWDTRSTRSAFERPCSSVLLPYCAAAGTAERRPDKSGAVAASKTLACCG